ncbi:MAG TPA: NAD-dependent epimerase/dehydratase family protein [Prolixibacteraceae bacterium]|nr:NAD-dependent epimerase/dehydratase family protein [Prolixibacteraceae bacterium]
MVFVTGGTGLVGSHLLLELVKGGKQVRALRRPSSNLEQVRKLFSWYENGADELFRRIEWVEGDILDLCSLEPLLRGVDLIYHCAAVVSFDGGQRKMMIHNNVEGTANLVNAALVSGVRRICHVSSVAALGRALPGFSVDENTNWVPARKNSGYSESKFFSETEIWRGAEEGLEVVVVNPSIILGPGNWESGSARLFRQVQKGLMFYTRGTTGFVDVRDVVAAMLLLTDDRNFEKAKRQRFLLNAENLSYRDFFSSVADALGKKRPSVYASNPMLGVAWRAARVWSLMTGRAPQITRETVFGANVLTSYNGEKIRRLFGFTYRPVAESIAHTASCLLRDNGR